MEEKENVLTYDYKTIRIKREMETIVCDTYESLGWKLTGTSSSEGSIFQINLSFKRNRKIENKIELLKLQDNADSILANIEQLQTKKKNAGTPEAISTGVVGALVFGGGMSMSMILSGIGYLIGGIALGIVGIGIGIASYFVYKATKRKKTSILQKLLDSEFDKLADVCEKSNQLIK